jgi:hypothetical protein
MGIVEILVSIFAVIGLILIISYAVFFLHAIIKTRRMISTASKINPPSDYMQSSGIKCPDYWVNVGVDKNGNYICKNSFNIKTNSNPKCNSEAATFAKMKPGYTWEYGNPNGLTTLTPEEKYKFLNENNTAGGLTRCEWINRCGSSQNLQGIWQGVNEICNNPQDFS